MSEFPEPSVAEPTVPFVAHDEPKKRRSGLLLGVGILAVAAIAAGGFLLLKKDTAEAGFSLAKASAAAQETKAVAFSMTIGAMGQTITAEAETDSDSGLSHIVMNLGQVAGSMEMVLDTNGKAVYFKSDLLAGRAPVDTAWVKMDSAFMANHPEVGGEAIFESADMGNPLDAGAMFENAKSVTEIGFDEVDGVKVKHFQVVVDTAAAMKVSPQLQKQVDQLKGDIPKELTYEVYVDEQNQIRRTTIDMVTAGQTTSVDVVIKPQTEPIVIEIPDPSDVTDFADLM